MSHYQVRFKIDKKHAYVYPASVRGVVWKNTMYHFSEPIMVGETDEEVKADGKQVIALMPKEAAKRVKELQEGFPPQAKLPEFPSAPVRRTPAKPVTRKQRTMARSKR